MRCHRLRAFCALAIFAALMARQMGLGGFGPFAFFEDDIMQESMRQYWMDQERLRQQEAAHGVRGRLLHLLLVLSGILFRGVRLVDLTLASSSYFRPLLCSFLPPLCTILL